MTASVWTVLDRFLADEIPFEELAAWVASTPALADVLAPDEYRSLRTLSAPAAAARVAAIYEAHRPGRLARDRAARLAHGMLDGVVGAAAGTRALARLRQDGHDWIPEAFTGLAAALDDLPAVSGDPRTDARAFGDRVRVALAQERRLRAPALVAARRLLERLAAGAEE